MSELKRKQFPYPDKNVFLVLGSRDGKPESSTAPLVIVSAREVVARQHYEAITRWKAVASTSLADMRKTKELFVNAKQDESIISIEGGVLAKWLEEPGLWAATYQKDGGHFVLIVKAHSPRDIKRHLEKQGALLLSLSNELSVDKCIQELQLHQWGKAREHRYATDFEGGEHIRDIDDYVKNRTEEERIDDQKIMARMRKSQVDVGA